MVRNPYIIFGVREIATDMDYKHLLKFCNLPTFERHLFFVLFFFFDKGKAKKSTLYCNVHFSASKKILPAVLCQF